MSNLRHKLILYNRFFKTFDRSVYHFRNCIQNTVLINKNINISVPLTTYSVKEPYRNLIQVQHRNYCTAIDNVTFEKVCDETLESLSDYFEELIENSPHLKSADVQYSSGVLTVNFGNQYGTYVINRQSPNLQIWLSSPTSGPKRYDFVPGSNHWVYKHDNVTLHQLLQKEIKDIVKQDIDFSKCSYSLL